MAERSVPPPLRELDEVAVVFDALSHASRRQILLVLQARGDSMTSRELSERFATTWATTSRHLGALERAGLVAVVEAEDGRERRYVLLAPQLVKTVDAWVDRFR